MYCATRKFERQGVWTFRASGCWLQRDFDGAKLILRKLYIDRCCDKLWTHRISPREDVREIVLECVQNFIQRHNIKINTVFNSEFVLGDKCANKCANKYMSRRNYELFRSSDLYEWYASHVVELILTSLEEFQERDSRWTLSYILNLTVNINKYNPLHAECHIEFLQEFKMKRAVVNVQSLGKHRVVALHSAKKIWSESYCNICITRL